MKWPLFYFFILCVTALLTELIRRYTLKTSILDIPNHRSSHQKPTPKTGGLAFIFSIFALSLLLFHLSYLSLNQLELIIGCGGFAVIMGLVGDYTALAARWRLLGQFFLCSLSLYILGSFQIFEIFDIYPWIPFEIFANVLAVFYLVWMLNLYNFMDGIDGLAAVELITVCVGVSLLYALNGHYKELMLPLGMAMAVGGFLLRNFPVAKIFMGDAGSGFLGFSLGILSLDAMKINPNYLWSWLILLAVFIVDATLTLLNRLYNKEKIYEGHCNHAYQYASRYYGTHKAVTLRVLLINILWLYPWALFVGYNLITGYVGLIIAYLPLIYLALKFNAGKNSSLNISLSNLR